MLSLLSSQAEEQQLLQLEQRRRGCQQSRREGSPYACYPVERRKSRKRKASPAGTPHCKNRFWLARAKAVLLHEIQQCWYGAEVKKQNKEKELKYIHIHTCKHTCVYIYKSKCANIHCPHSILLMLEKSSFLAITLLEVELAYSIKVNLQDGFISHSAESTTCKIKAPCRTQLYSEQQGWGRERTTLCCCQEIRNESKYFTKSQNHPAPPKNHTPKNFRKPKQPTEVVHI